MIWDNVDITFTLKFKEWEALVGAADGAYLGLDEPKLSDAAKAIETIDRKLKEHKILR